MPIKYGELRIRSFNQKYLDYMDDVIRFKNKDREKHLYTRKDILEEIIDFYIENSVPRYSDSTLEKMETVYKKTSEKLNVIEEKLDEYLDKETMLLALYLKERGLLNE